MVRSGGSRVAISPITGSLPVGESSGEAGLTSAGVNARCWQMTQSSCGAEVGRCSLFSLAVSEQLAVEQVFAGEWQ